MDSRQAGHSGVLSILRAQTDHLLAALRDRNELTALPESFGQLTALKDLNLSQRSACVKVGRGPCAVVGWACGAEWVPGFSVARQSDGLLQKHFVQRSGVCASAHPCEIPPAFSKPSLLELAPLQPLCPEKYRSYSPFFVCIYADGFRAR